MQMPMNTGLAISSAVYVFVFFGAFTLTEASVSSSGMTRRESRSTPIEIHVDVNALERVAGDVGRQPHLIRKAVLDTPGEQKSTHAYQEIDTEIDGKILSDLKTVEEASPKNIWRAPYGQEIAMFEGNVPAGQIVAWLSNEGFKEAAIEALFAGFAFLFASVFRTRIRQRDRQQAISGIRSSASKLNKLVTPVSSRGRAAQRVPLIPAAQQLGSIAVTHRGNVTRTPSSFNDFVDVETSTLVAAIKSGRAAELPRLLATLQARAGARGDEMAGMEDRILIVVLRACAAKQSFKEALAAYDYWVEAIADVTESKGIWSLLLYVAASSGAFVRCWGFYEKVCEEGPPSSHDFVNLVRALAHQQDLDGLCTAIERARKLHSFPLNAFTRNRALAACGGENALELAATLLRADVCTEPPDVLAYNTLMRVFARQGRLDTCFQLFNEMRTKGLEPSKISFGILLDACVCAEDSDKARAVCEDLCQSGFRLNEVSCTTCMKGLVRAGRLGEAAIMLKDMQQSPDAKPDLTTYTTLVKAYTDRGCVEHALEILGTMVAQRVKPDETTFNCVISACVQSPVSSKEAVRVFDTLQKFGLRPSTKSLSVLLKNLTLNGDYELALSFLQEVPRRCGGLQVEARLFAQIVHAATQGGEGEQASLAFEAMCDTLQQRDETLDYATHHRLVRHCLNCGQHVAAERLREAARRVGLSRPFD